MDKHVDSCPPCKVWVELKTAAGLPAKAPCAQSELVLSKKYFIGAAMLPKRVGLPMIKPSAWANSSSVT
jgi:hypothetical protein